MYLVDGDDQLGSLHSSKMLDRPRDTDSEVQLRGDNLGGDEREGHRQKVSSDGPRPLTIDS